MSVRDSTSTLSRLTKAELVELCRAKNLKVSGTKQELLARLSEERKAPAHFQAPFEAPPTEEVAPSAMAPFDDRGDEVSVAALDSLISRIAADPGGITPDVLLEKTDLLLKDGGSLYDRVKRRRLASADTETRGAVALLDGFVQGQQRSRARDAVRLVLRAATESTAAIDEVFRRLREDGDLGSPLEAYVDGLLDERNRRRRAQQNGNIMAPPELRDREGGLGPEKSNGFHNDLARNPALQTPLKLLENNKKTPAEGTAADDDVDDEDDDLLTRVLLIVKDRIKAEHHVAQSRELRTLAQAMMLDDPEQRKNFLAKALGDTIEFAQAFEEYVQEALAFVENQEGGTSLPNRQRDAIKDVARIVGDLRRAMPL